jgi:glycine/sarcosine N-methyltransferase
MVQATDTEPLHQALAFYDRLAPDYDAMTGFEKRFVVERPFFRVLVERYAIRTALDAGCGTGFHSLLLSQLGAQVTAVDVSQEMLKRAQLHAAASGTELRTVHSDFLHLRENVKGTFDGIFSMGNTLPHILSANDLLLTLQSFAELLHRDGLLFIQNLNYDRILRTQEPVQSVKEQDGVTFVRYYEFAPSTIRFNILKITRSAGGPQHSLNTVELRPVLKEEIMSMLAQAGFRDIRPFGGISMEEFVPDTSKDLVLLARK